MYMTGDYPDAGKCLEAEIAKEPKNASAHYLMGNVFFAEKRMDDAAREYELAAKLAPTSAVGQYSRLALSTVATSRAQQQQHEIKQPTLVSPQSDLTADNPMKRSVRAISRQADQSDQEVSAECTARVNDIQNDAEKRIAKLRADMQERQDANGVAIRGRRGWAYNPAEANNAIQEDYQAQMDAVRAESRRKTDEITAYYKNRQTSINESALRIDKDYEGTNQNSRVMINPLGTNMYARNYQTKDEPSGNPVPIMAAPPKLLSPNNAKAH